MSPGFDDLPTTDPGAGDPGAGDASAREAWDGAPDDLPAAATGAGEAGSGTATETDANADADADADADAPRSTGERWWAASKPLMLPGVLLVGVLVLIVRARATLEQSPRFVVDPSVCTVVARPAWVSDGVARSIALAVATGLGRQASLLQGRELQRWADALTDPAADISPWIESVERLEPHFPSQADVRIRLRVPVMVVDGALLVAASGHVLGPGPVAVSPAPLQYAGRHLDEDYIECAAAAGELVPYRDELDRAGVRVVSVGIGEDGTVVFTTDAGVELSWGRSARKSAWSHLDLPPSERLGNLRQVLVDFPGLASLRRVQLWTDRPVTTLRSA
ncbi:MAG TPA: hypothetical protein VK824_12860 [Planctomycetota bacterium]|nr:hypothetical protein [Planctomycetota bacterium]